MSHSLISSAQEKTLRITPVTDERPGLILHDFQVMLDFVAEESPALTKTHLLPSKTVLSLNGRLSRRIEHGFTRPKQKSFPHIDGLFLLLRASGLTRVDTTGRKPVLVVDPDAVNSWRDLNSTERYFTLLESWLLRGDPEIVSERAGAFLFNNPLLMWSEFFRQFE